MRERLAFTIFNSFSIFGPKQQQIFPKVFERENYGKKFDALAKVFSALVCGFPVYRRSHRTKMSFKVSKLVSARVFCWAEESGRFSFLKDRITTIVLAKNNRESMCVTHRYSMELLKTRRLIYI
jgi:hypothetical protein